MKNKNMFEMYTYHNGKKVIIGSVKNMPKKSAAEICAEVAIREDETDFDLGKPLLGALMYEELMKQGYIKKHLNHPLDRLVYISRLLRRDTKRDGGFWLYAGKIDYQGIQKRPVNVYKLRDRL